MMTAVATKRMRLVSLVGLFTMLLSMIPPGVMGLDAIVPGAEVAQAASNQQAPTVEITFRVCDRSDLPGDGRSFADLESNCTNLPTMPVTFNVRDLNTAGEPVSQHKLDAQGKLKLDLAPGAFDLFTDLDMGNWGEYLFCEYEGQPQYEKKFDPQRGIITFTDLIDEQITCDWFAVHATSANNAAAQPATENNAASANMRADAGSGSIEVHLSACPVGYTGSDMYNDCHAEGVEGSEFTLTGSGVNQTETTVIEETPGPGIAKFTDLRAGQYELAGGPPQDVGSVSLYCSGPADESPVTSFESGKANLTLAENQTIECDWYFVPTDQSAPVQRAQVAPAAVPSASVEVHLSSCPVGYDGGDYYNDCHAEGVADQEFTLIGPGVDQAANTVVEEIAGPGIARFTDLPTGDYVLAGGPPQDFGSVFLYCSDPVTSTQVTTTFEGGKAQLNLAENQDIVCDWYFIPYEKSPSTGDASINVAMMACENDQIVSDTSSLDEFQTKCTEPVSKVEYTLTNDAETTLNGVTNAEGEASFTGLADGNWRIWSGIPLEAATEYYFCTDGSGDYAAKTLSDRGVASFEGFSGQTINCQVYVVPDNLRGDVTGASLEVHLSSCPVGYDGSDYYNDCHADGVADQEFTLTGPGVDTTVNTVVERTPGPGIARFTALPAGDYVLAGGPPQDFGSVFLYCSDPASGTQVTTTFEGGKAQLNLAENQSIVCDWYFTPDDQGVVTPIPASEKAEIFTTMFVCPPSVNVAGSGFSQLDGACAERLSDVPMTLQSPGGVPITAITGESGEGAIRFYDLLGGDYVLTPKLPAEYVSAAVYCDLDGGNVYQKALSNGSTTFTNVDGELISCSWFVTAKPKEAPGPVGSITIREMLCKGDRATIVDWERECQPGASGVSFTIASSGGGVTQTLFPNAQGVAVFGDLPDEYYEVKQSEGAWCRAKAERVDAQSRVIVSGGSNTDVFLYQCNQEIGLPNTGSGSIASDTELPLADSITLTAIALPLFAIAAWHIRRWQLAATSGSPVAVSDTLTRIRNGCRYR